MKALSSEKNPFFKYSNWILIAPFIICFTLFILLPVLVSFVLSFTKFDSVQFPQFVGLQNYIDIFSNDRQFMQKVLPNTIIYAVIVGPGGYILSFLLAWVLSQLTRLPRTVLAIVFYSPSLLGSVALTTIWSVLFSGDRNGYLNNILLSMNVIDEPVTWFTSASTLMPIMIFVALWSSMGVGFLAMLSGVLNVDQELYEAAYIDGVKNRAQEIYYVTIPSTKPQLLFGAVMQIVSSFSACGVTQALAGSPSPQYAADTIVLHIADVGNTRYEMGYACAIATVLFLLMALSNFLVKRLLARVGS